jgi:hypothetical protein
MEAQNQRQQQFFELAERLRNATDPEEAKRLGDQLGRMMFGDTSCAVTLRTCLP